MTIVHRVRRRRVLPSSVLSIQMPLDVCLLNFETAVSHSLLLDSVVLLKQYIYQIPLQGDSRCIEVMAIISFVIDLTLSRDILRSLYRQHTLQQGLHPSLCGIPSNLLFSYFEKLINRNLSMSHTRKSSEPVSSALTLRTWTYYSLSYQ